MCVLGLLLLQVIPGWLPNRPIIQLPGEVVWNWPGKKDFLGGLFGKGMLNTQNSLLFLVIPSILFIAMRVRSGIPKNGEAPSGGFYGFFEMLFEMMYGYVEDAAGKKWASTFFPYFMTFVMWIVLANWWALFPGVDSIGKWETMGEYEGHIAQDAYIADYQASHEGYSYYKVYKTDESKEVLLATEKKVNAENKGGLRDWPFLINANAADESAELVEDPTRHYTYTGRNPEAADWALVPYFRPAASDLNFTLAIALISVIMTQFYGMKAQGMSYWGKFFTFPADKIAKDPLKVLDPVVGLLEFISEVFKIVSFAFRLLGAVFGGMVLLFVIANLAPVGNLLFVFLEFAVGTLQGVVFALLTLTFMKGATEHHH